MGGFFNYYCKTIMSTSELKADVIVLYPAGVVEEITGTMDKINCEPQHRDLGPEVLVSDIPSIEGPFNTFPEYEIVYPPVVIEALGNLYAEYNEAFRKLVEANKENDDDYKYILDKNGCPINLFVQIDMVALDESFLEKIRDVPEPVLREVLRRRIFEFENSLAMTPLLERVVADSEENMYFKREFRTSLEKIRNEHGKKVAVLAVTDAKYRAIMQSEFGSEGEAISDDKINEISGFDTVMSPTMFKEYMEKLGENESEYLFIVRSSDPIDKLKNPKLPTPETLLSNPMYRKFIKQYSLTFNIDDPEWGNTDPRRINDTKGYQESMYMAYTISDIDDLRSQGFLQFLMGQGIIGASDIIDPDILRDKINALHLRAKPSGGTYGCYGHCRGALGDKKFRENLRSELNSRGSYVVQPEMIIPTIVDNKTGKSFKVIDRNFLTFVNGKPVFMQGYRTMMPIDSTEAKKGRIHGAGEARWARVVDERPTAI